MLQHECAIELQRLSAVLGKPFDQADAKARSQHLEECMRRFGFLPIAVWRAVVTWVIDHADHRGLPYISDYSKALDVVRKQIGYTASVSCEGCGGMQFKPVAVIANILGDQKRYDAVEPCPLCNSHFTVPGTFHQPPVVKIDAPTLLGVERFIAEKTAIQPDYEQKVRKGWFSLWGFDSTGISFIDAAKVIVERMKAGEIGFTPKWALKKQWAEEASHEKLVRQQANAILAQRAANASD